MSAPTRRSAAPRPVVRRRRLVGLAALLAVAAAAVAVVAGTSTSPSAPAAPRFVRVELGGTTLARKRVSELRGPGAVAALLKSVPATRTAQGTTSTITYRVDRGAASRAVERAVRRGGGTVKIVERPVASRIQVPLIKQVLQDDCEVTALAMVLAYGGHRVGQLTLQKEVAHSPPLDPTVAADGSEVWGDPSKGFVGRADGGGPAGGFGVYQGPIRALARHHGVTLNNLTGSKPGAVYASLLEGKPVVAWVALSDGPYAAWTSPTGATVRVNYGEHALVLTGVDRESVQINDPLSGTRLTWPKTQFEQMWAGLGQRALSTSTTPE